MSSTRGDGVVMISRPPGRRMSGPGLETVLGDVLDDSERIQQRLGHHSPAANENITAVA